VVGNNIVNNIILQIFFIAHSFFILPQNGEIAMPHKVDENPLIVKLIDFMCALNYLIEMLLSSRHLQAFSEVAKTASFSAAAKNLHITQSALSQRISNLESELATGLIVRDPSGLRLTAAGEQLLRYCRTMESLEKEVLGQISSEQSALQGVMRIGGFSSIIRSVVIPSLDRLMIDNSLLNVELYSRELADLPRMLANNELDVMLTLESSTKHEIESHLLGYEVNVLVESTAISKERQNIYLDHDLNDKTTQQFFAHNNLDFDKKRNYLDEVYCLLDGVKHGWGRAVLPRHLLKDQTDLRVVKRYKPLKLPILLQYYRQPYYSRLFKTVVEELKEQCRHYLEN